MSADFSSERSRERAPIIVVDGLTKRFGSFRAVEGVSLVVRPGEVVGLLGPNGAGKTTTLRMLAGLISPSEGRAQVGGFDVKTHPLEARKQLAFMTASTGLYDRLTAREVLVTFAALYGVGREPRSPTIEARIEALSQLLELGPFLDRRCATLSSGQKQRVGIARAIVHDPPAFVLDEPTAALDPLASRAILDVVRDARARGKAVLFSTHRMEEAEFVCDRLLFLRGGRVVTEGTPRGLCERSGQRSLAGAFLHYALEQPVTDEEREERVERAHR